MAIRISGSNSHEREISYSSPCGDGKGISMVKRASAPSNSENLLRGDSRLTSTKKMCQHGEDYTRDIRVYNREISRSEFVKSACSNDYCDVSEICSLLTDTQKARFERVGKDPGLQARMESILREMFSCDLFNKPDTCDVLYWGLVNQKINPDQFMEYYQYLMLRLTFFSETTGVNNLLNETIPNIAESVQAVQEHGMLIYKVVLSDKCSAEVFKDLKRLPCCGDDMRACVIGWLSRINYIDGGVELKDGNLIIHSWRELMKDAVSKSRHHKNLTPLITFGSGDWENLKKLRYQNKHPVALWHPDIPESMLNPDGFKIGTLSLFHDIYHILQTNKVSQEDRVNMLNMDSAWITPLMALVEAVTCGQTHTLDKQQQSFLQGFSILCSEMADGYACGYLSEELEEETVIASISDDIAKKGRPLIDQEFGLDVSSMRAWAYPETCLYSGSPEKLFIISLMIFRAVTAPKAAFSQVIEHSLGISIKKYPETREKMKAKIFEDRLDKNTSKEWLVDWWYRYCRG